MEPFEVRWKKSTHCVNTEMRLTSDHLVKSRLVTSGEWVIIIFGGDSRGGLEERREAEGKQLRVQGRGWKGQCWRGGGWDERPAKRGGREES